MFLEIINCIFRIVILFLPALSTTMSLLAFYKYADKNIYGDEPLSEHFIQKIHALFDKINAPKLKKMRLLKLHPTFAPIFLTQGKPMLSGHTQIFFNEDFLTTLPEDEFEALILQSAGYIVHNTMRHWMLSAWVIQAVCGLLSYLILQFSSLYSCILPVMLCTLINSLLYWNIIAVFIGTLLRTWYFSYENIRFSFALAQQSGHITGYINLYQRLYDLTKLPLFLDKITYFNKYSKHE